MSLYCDICQSESSILPDGTGESVCNGCGQITTLKDLHSRLDKLQDLIDGIRALDEGLDAPSEMGQRADELREAISNWEEAEVTASL